MVFYSRGPPHGSAFAGKRDPERYVPRSVMHIARVQFTRAVVQLDMRLFVLTAFTLFVVSCGVHASSLALNHFSKPQSPSIIDAQTPPAPDLQAY